MWNSCPHHFSVISRQKIKKVKAVVQPNEAHDMVEHQHLEATPRFKPGDSSREAFNLVGCFAAARHGLRSTGSEVFDRANISAETSCG
jgi:hypothetical protein